MGFTDKRFLSWLSQLDEAEPVPLQENQPSEKFTFDGIPKEKQTLNTRPPKKRSAQPSNLRQPCLELENFEQPLLPSRPTTKGTDLRISRKEKNGYERIPRAKTKEDRYEYKGSSSRVKKDRATGAPKKKASKQKRKHTINEEFRASNVPSNRLTLHSATNLGFFNKGKRSSPVKTRILDQGFSEADFLSKKPADAQASELTRPLKHSNKFDFFNEPEMPDHRSDPVLESLRPIHEAAEQHPQSINIETDQNHTAVCLEPESCSTPKSIADAVPFSQPFSRDKDRVPSETPIACSQAKQDMRPIEDQQTMQLLNIGPCSPTENSTRSSARRYWTLEELKSIMARRILVWKPEHKEKETTVTRSKEGSRKRKHGSSIERDHIVSRTPLKKKVQHPRQTLSIISKNKSTSPFAAVLEPCLSTEQSTDHPLGEIIPEFGKTDYAMEANHFQPQRPCYDIGPSLIYDDEAYHESQAFDAAYEAIMRSDSDVPFGLPGYTPMGNANAGRGEGRTVPALQDAYKWNSGREGVLDPFQVEQQMFSSYTQNVEMAWGQAGTGNHSQQSYPGAFCVEREPLQPVEQNLVLGLGRVPRRGGSEPHSLDVDVGPMKSFWRQNKLY